MTREDLQGLAKLLALAPWNWADPTLLDACHWLDAETISTSGNRHVLRLQNGIELDAYLYGDNVIAVEVVLEFAATDGLSASGIDDLSDQFTAKFESAVDDIAKVLGQPTFSDDSAAEGFPHDQDAMWLALWPLKNSRLMLQVKHEGADVPIRLAFVVTGHGGGALPLVRIPVPGT